MTAYTAERQRTMAVRALRRLSETELLGLGVALTLIEQTEAQLCQHLGDLRRAAEKERYVRRGQGLEPTGHYVRGYEAAFQLLHALTVAREQASTASETGRVPRKSRAKP